MESEYKKKSIVAQTLSDLCIFILKFSRTCPTYKKNISGIYL
jgi:hypothetical protein